MRNIAQGELLAALLALRPELEREGVTHVALFGSRARRDNRPDSDIDLVIDVDEGRRFSVFDLVGVGNIVKDTIGIPTSVFMRRGFNEEFKRQAARDEVPVF